MGDSSEFQTIIKNNSAETVLTLTDETVNANEVKAGFTFNNGKNPTSIQFSETLTAMEKGTDSAGKIEYYFIDETTERDDVIMTITQDVITDFEKIINDSTVNNLLKQFISTATGDVSVIRDAAGDIIIKTATDTFNISDEIRAKETNTTLTSSGAGVYVYKNEEAIKTNGAGITINIVSDVQNNFQEIIDNTSVQTILNEYLTQNISNVKVINKNGDTVFVVNEGGVETEVNISEIIRGEAYVASLALQDSTVNEEGVKAGFSFNDGKNTASQVFAETLTSLNKGVDAEQKIEYTYKDETGGVASTKITVTQDVISDFEKIINDTTVNNLLKQFISTTSGDVSVIRDTTGDIIIKTATDTFNLTNEIQAKETLTSLRYEQQSVQENGNTVDKYFLIYTPERGAEQRIDLATLVESSETLTSLLNKQEAGVKVPAVYIYTDENKITWEINLPEELKQSTEFTDYINSFITNIPSTVVNYSTVEVIKPEKW